MLSREAETNSLFDFKVGDAIGLQERMEDWKRACKPKSTGPSHDLDKNHEELDMAIRRNSKSMVSVKATNIRNDMMDILANCLVEDIGGCKEGNPTHHIFDRYDFVRENEVENVWIDRKTNDYVRYPKGVDPNGWGKE
jgi:hypothetical protein